MRALQRQRLALETEDEREARLLHKRTLRQRDDPSHLPPLEQSQVQAKMLKFHQQIAKLEVPTCSVCHEQFPGMKINSMQTECLRCSRDKLTPKLFSADNGMHPGKVPVEMQVR